MKLEQQILAAETQSELDAIVASATRKHSLYFKLYNILNAVNLIAVICGFILDVTTFSTALCVFLVFGIVCTLVILVCVPNLYVCQAPNEYQCRKALEIIASSPAAKYYRNEMAMKGIHLTVAHVHHLEKLKEEEVIKTNLYKLNTYAN